MDLGCEWEILWIRNYLINPYNYQNLIQHNLSIMLYAIFSEQKDKEKGTVLSILILSM